MKYSSFRNKTGGGYKRIPANSIINWVERNFDYKTRKDGQEYLICDPFSGDTNFKFNINPEKGTCHSWHGDEWAGSVNPKTGKRNCTIVRFIRTLNNCTYKDALSELLGDTGNVSEFMSPRSRNHTSEPVEKLTEDLPDGLQLLAGSEDIQALILINWLMARGYSYEDIEKDQLFFVGLNVYWPYYEFDEMVYWQARSRMNKRFLFPSQEKYDKKGNIIAKSEATKGDFYYGFDDVELASFVIITEAIFDKNTIGDQCLASGGADLTLNQIKKLKLLDPKKGIILSPDNDSAAIKSVLRNKQQLERLGYPLFYSIPPKLKYKTTKSDGTEEIKITKDWNEIGQYVSGFDKVRKIFDGNIKKLTIQEIIKLQKMLDRS